MYFQKNAIKRFNKELNLNSRSCDSNLLLKPWYFAANNYALGTNVIHCFPAVVMANYSHGILLPCLTIIGKKRGTLFPFTLFFYKY